jgi:secondary thiamine-phosphate synthase enzyme
LIWDVKERDRDANLKELTLLIYNQTMTQHHQNTLKIRTQAKSLHKITTQVQAVVAASGIRTGLCTVFVRHTSASLVIQENADPDVLKDLANFFSELVPESRSYIHDTEGPDDMPAHIRSALTHTSEQIPIANQRLVLGTWQGIYLWEHRAYPHTREIVVHVSGI